MVTYVHIVEGRMRIRLLEIKGDSVRSACVVKCLQQLQGVMRIRANPTTGSVLILFDSAIIQPYHIVQTLREHGFLTRSEVASLQRPVSPSASTRMIETLVNVAFEKVVWQVIVALM